MTSKHRERHLLECFLKSAGIEPLAIMEHEKPDFILSLPHGKVGIEVTELLKTTHPSAPPERAQESIADQVIEKARRLYEQRGGSPALVSVLFSPGHDLRKVHRDELANVIAVFIEKLAVNNGQRVIWRPGDMDIELPDAVSFAQILGVPSKKYANWSSPRAGWVACLTSEEIGKRISAKAVKLSEYKKSADQVWLLIVADRTRPSQMFEHRGAFDPTALKHPFERAYYYSYPENLILTLGGDYS
jgi:hypothetical protein